MIIRVLSALWQSLACTVALHPMKKKKSVAADVSPLTIGIFMQLQQPPPRETLTDTKSLCITLPLSLNVTSYHVLVHIQFSSRKSRAHVVLQS